MTSNPAESASSAARNKNVIGRGGARERYALPSTSTKASAMPGAIYLRGKIGTTAPHSKKQLGVLSDGQKAITLGAAALNPLRR